MRRISSGSSFEVFMVVTRVHTHRDCMGEGGHLQGTLTICEPVEQCRG